MSHKSFLNQDYEKIKNNFLGSGELFIDTEFPASIQSIARYNFPNQKIFWKRPRDIVENPQFLIPDSNPNDIIPGFIIALVNPIFIF